MTTIDVICVAAVALSKPPGLNTIDGIGQIHRHRGVRTTPSANIERIVPEIGLHVNERKGADRSDVATKTTACAKV